MAGRNIGQTDLEHYVEIERRKDEEKKKQKRKKKIINCLITLSVGCLPLLLMLFVVFLVVFITLGIIDTDGDGVAQKCINVKSADEVCKSVTVNGQTLSVDDYVAGVISAEVGGFDSYTNGIEVMKANAIAARTYALNTASKDNSGNCNMGSAGESTQAFTNASTGAKQASEETSGMILIDDNGSAAFTQYSSVLLTNAYDSFGDSVTFSENNGSLSVPKSWADTYILKYCPRYTGGKGVSVYRDSYGGYGCGHGNGMSQVGALYLASEKGYTYEQILDYYYSDDGFDLASTKGASSKCTSVNNNEFGSLTEYNLNHKGLSVLSEPLTKDEINKLNSYVEGEMDKNDSSYNNKVAAAGQALVYWFEQNNKYLSYYWGGGHEIFTGASSSWGVNRGSDEHGHTYYGMDCSGFVSWSIRNACKADFTALAEDFLGMGKTISLADAKPGDVVASVAHVMLVVKNNGDETVTVAEEGGSSDGLVFSIVDSNRMSWGKRSVIDMSDWYKNNCS